MYIKKPKQLKARVYIYTSMDAALPKSPPSLI